MEVDPVTSKPERQATEAPVVVGIHHKTREPGQGHQQDGDAMEQAQQ
jgi:hypothetical protein